MTDQPAATRRPSRPRLQAMLWLHGFLTIVAAATALSWVFAKDYHSDGRCTGIGFGCTPSPKDGILFAVILFTPGVAVALAFIGIPITLWTSRRLRPWLAGLLGAATALVSGVALSLLLLALTGVLH